MNKSFKKALTFVTFVKNLFLWIITASKDAVAPDMGPTAASLLCVFCSAGAVTILAIPAFLFLFGWSWWLILLACVTAYLITGLIMASVMSDFGWKLSG